VWSGPTGPSTRLLSEGAYSPSIRLPAQSAQRGCGSRRVLAAIQKNKFQRPRPQGAGIVTAKQQRHIRLDKARARRKRKSLAIAKKRATMWLTNQGGLSCPQML